MNKTYKQTYKQIAEELWRLLDSIDTLPDMLHPHAEKGHEQCWKMMVKRAEKRYSLLKSDGFTLTLPKINKSTERLRN